MFVVHEMGNQVSGRILGPRVRVLDMHVSRSLSFFGVERSGHKQLDKKQTTRCEVIVHTKDKPRGTKKIQHTPRRCRDHRTYKHSVALELFYFKH